MKCNNFVVFQRNRMKTYHSTFTEALLKKNFPITEKGVKLLKIRPLMTDSGHAWLACLVDDYIC